MVNKNSPWYVDGDIVVEAATEDGETCFIFTVASDDDLKLLNECIAEYKQITDQKILQEIYYNNADRMLRSYDDKIDSISVNEDIPSGYFRVTSNKGMMREYPLKKTDYSDSFHTDPLLAALGVK